MKLLVIVAALVAFSATSRAQEDARARFEAGVQAYDARDYQTALAAFSDAYRIKPHPVVRLNIANCHERLGRHTDAADQYRLFLEEMPESPKAPEVNRSLARISKRIGTIHIQAEPKDARVTINGEPIDANEPQRVNAGRYTIEASAAGYTSRTEELAVPGGSEPRVRFHLEATNEPSGEPSDEAVDISEQEPSYGLDEEEETAEELPSEAGSDIPTSTWIAGGVAVALAAGALTIGLMAVSAESDFEDEVRRSNDLSLSADQRMEAYSDGIDAHDRANSLALVSDLFLIGSAAAATTAVIFLLTQDDETESEESFSALPVLSPYGAGATIRSTF